MCLSSFAKKTNVVFAHDSTYSKWFATASRVVRYRLFLCMSVSKSRVFHCFRMGVHNLPIDSGRRRGIPLNGSVIRIRLVWLVMNISWFFLVRLFSPFRPGIPFFFVSILGRCASSSDNRTFRLLSTSCVIVFKPGPCAPILALLRLSPGGLVALPSLVLGQVSSS